MTKRWFTPAEANRTLPLVKRIVADILSAGRALSARMAGSGRTDREAIEELEREVRRLMTELDQIGCQYKDWNFQVGLVDFPARLGGREVLLCWKSDEPSVAWYHPVEAGFAGRLPIPPHLLEDEPVGAPRRER